MGSGDRANQKGYSAGNPFEFNRDRLKISGCADDRDEFRTAADNKKRSYYNKEQILIIKR